MLFEILEKYGYKLDSRTCNYYKDYTYISNKLPLGIISITDTFNIGSGHYNYFYFNESNGDFGTGPDEEH